MEALVEPPYAELQGGDTMPRDGVEAFTVQSVGYGMRIACTLGPSPGFSRLVIRYRTDGVVPSTPEDGFPLLDAPALGGAAYWGCHDPPYRGVAYTYRVFGLDDRGSIRASATTRGVPSTV